MATADQQAAFQARVDDILAQMRSLDDEALARALQILEDARRQILDDLTRVPTDSYDVMHLAALKREIDGTITDLVRTYQAEIPGLVKRAEELGIELVDGSLQAAGLSYSGGLISTQLVAVLQGYSADLVSALGNEALARINAILTRAALGVMNPHDAIQAIAAALPDSSVFRTLEARASAIFRTEVNRIYSVATFGRLQDMATRIPSLGKEWVAVDDERTRPWHFTTGTAFVFNGQPTVVPVGQPFYPGGEAAMYPRDPSLSPANSISCRCSVVPSVNVSAVLDQLGKADLVGLGIL